MSNTTDVPGNLTPDQKRELLARLLKEKARQEVVRSPLSYGQRALWFMYQLDPTSAAYNIMYAAHLREDFNSDALRGAFQALVNRHAVLRTTYGMHEGSPVQEVHAYQEVPFETVDATAWSWDTLQEEIQAQSDIPFDLKEGPVIRVLLFQRPVGEQPVVLFVVHHIALDFWSFDLLFDELEALYRQEVTGTNATLFPQKIQYTDYVSWQEKMLAGEQGQRQWEYWQQQLSGDLPNLDLPADHPRPPVQTFRGSSFHFQLPDELSSGLINLAKQQSTTLFAAMLAAFQVLLYRYSGQQDILVGSPTAGRSRAELEDLLGYFLNPIVLRARVAPEQSFLEFLDQVRQTVIDGIAHQDFPFPLLVERLHPPRDVSRSPIFQVAFGWDKPRRLSEEGDEPITSDEAITADPAALGLEPFALGQQGAAFDMMLMMLNMGDSVSAALQYNSDLFDESSIVRFVSHFEALLAGIVADPDRALADLPLLEYSERNLLLDQWNATERDYPRDRCLHELFEAQVTQNPDAVAVESDGRQLTYRQLDQRANQLARHLVQMGAGPQTLVAICIERSVDMLVGILGILKAGGAYVPLAPGTPHDRITYMLQESQAPVLLTQGNLADDLPPHAAQVVRIDDDWSTIATQTTEGLGRTAEPTSLAYVIFTSGSTGKPKGVQLEHRSVVNFLNSMQRQPGIGPQDTLLAVTTLTFDISVLELFLPLAVGARVIIVGEKIASDGTQLAEVLSQSGATVMQATPATWRLLVEAGWPGDPQLKVLCGGEALPRDLAEQLLPRCARLWNMYGPTETTIWSAVDRVQSGEGLLPIGRPIDNTQIYILDSRQQPVPIGVPGDLFIAGDGLARGYLNRPELTAERFVSNPFSDDSAARMYKTGDIARYRADGNIEFLGRSDFQVKIRGFRIELGEIEANLDQHPAIGQAVVMARQTGPREDDKQLVAYLVPAAELQPNTTELREYLRQELPDYMLPATFMWLDRFPLNPAGKIDRKALPEPDTSRPELQTEYVAPRDEKEVALAQIWADVLGLEKIGIHDNFFDLGGASIQSLEIGAIAETEGLKITPAMLFQHPTIAELAAVAPAVESDAVSDTAAGDGNGAAVAAAAKPVPTTTKTAARPIPDRRRDTEKANTIIESLGVYFPPKQVTTKELIKGCKHKMWFPLERMTGIHSRHMAGEDEFSIDLAIKAVDECLQHSKYDADDIDVVIACNITRLDKHRTLSLEPNTSLQPEKALRLQ